MIHTNYSNALANITQRLIGQGQEFATVYPVIYPQKPKLLTTLLVIGQCSGYASLRQLTFCCKHLDFDV